MRTIIIEILVLLFSIYVLLPCFLVIFSYLFFPAGKVFVRGNCRSNIDRKMVEAWEEHIKTTAASNKIRAKFAANLEEWQSDKVKG
jgi:hypothetical protein